MKPKYMYSSCGDVKISKFFPSFGLIKKSILAENAVPGSATLKFSLTVLLKQHLEAFAWCDNVPEPLKNMLPV